MLLRREKYTQSGPSIVQLEAEFSVMRYQTIMNDDDSDNSNDNVDYGNDKATMIDFHDNNSNDKIQLIVVKIMIMIISNRAYNDNNQFSYFD